MNGLDVPTRHRCLEVLNEIRLSCCPYDIPDCEWVDDVSLWPPVTYPDGYSYRIEIPGQFTRQSLKAYKSLEAYNYVVNKWVKGLFVLKKESCCREGGCVASIIRVWFIAFSLAV